MSKQILYGKSDFPTGFLVEQLYNELIVAYGQVFSLETAPNDYVRLTLQDSDLVNENNIRATCLAHFGKSSAQRASDLADAQTDQAMVNGDKNKRFLLEVFYQIDKRVRVLESAPAITKQQFLNGIKILYKNA